jgi:hypothetical protein
VTGAEVLEDLSVNVEVRGGAAVEGALEVLRVLDDGGFVVGWQADAGLDVGTRLDVTYSGPGGSDTVQGTAALEVTGAPAVLALPSLTFTRWVDFGHGVGDSVQCQLTGLGGGCAGPPTVEVFVAEERRKAVEVEWRMPVVHGFVFWETELDATPASDLKPPTEYSFAHSDPGSEAEQAPYGALVVFPSDAEQYCVTLKVRDVRSGLEDAVQACAEPQPPSLIQLDYPLPGCGAPPSSELKERWCDVRRQEGLSCEPTNIGAGGSRCGEPAAGGGAGAGGPSAGGSASGGTHSGGTTTSSLSAGGGTSNSSGCHMSGSRTAGWSLSLGLLGLGAMGLVVRRRRRV